ncbi:MAG: MoaD/ThiS family protein [Fluviicola sp.]
MGTTHRKVTVAYYGMLAERLGMDSEVLELPSGEVNLRNFFQNVHPQLEGLTFLAAVDLEYKEVLSETSQPNKIDLMPPFAGG